MYQLSSGGSDEEITSSTFSPTLSEEGSIKRKHVPLSKSKEKLRKKDAPNNEDLTQPSSEKQTNVSALVNLPPCECIHSSYSW